MRLTYNEIVEELESQWDEEVDLAWYCHFYGPCDACKKSVDD